MRKLLFGLVFLVACQTATPAPSASRLETTPRHDEWVDAGGVRTYVVYPQVSNRAPAIVVIHENRGLTDWVRTVADRLAENGYIALAPDLLGDTKSFASEDAAREAIGKLDRAKVIENLRSVAEYARGIPAANGTVAVGGFCWGGGRAWDVAANVEGISAAYVFYGTGPDGADTVAGIEAPVYGFYGGNDARVNATIPKTEELMKAAGKRFEPVIYEGAGHAFMRAGEAADAEPANRKAKDDAWKRWLALLGAK
jgi:carboxymethylenebutenolidase